MEGATQRCSVDKVFINIIKNSQENACAGVSFLDKVVGWRFWKENQAEVFSCKCFVVIKNINIAEQLQTAASKVEKDF